MNSSLPTSAALAAMVEAFPDQYVTCELRHTVSGGTERIVFRTCAVVNGEAFSGEDADDMRAVKLAIKAGEDHKDRRLQKARAELEAAGYAVSK